MAHLLQVWLPCLVTLLLALSLPNSQARLTNENSVRSAVFFSPEFVLGSGSVAKKFYYDIEFPRGHIALKGFNAEVVDEVGNPIPLHETYLHHWIVYRYYQRKGVDIQEANDTDFINVRNSGLCDNGLWQYFGSGSETRRTATHVPDPYGIEVGNLAEIPPGYEEKWLLNVHAVDTRGVEDRLGCIECRCDLYNITRGANVEPLSPGYTGGMECCYDQTQCRIKEGFESVKRSLFMKYSVKWVDWDTSIKPVKIFVFDVTDTWKKVEASTGHATRHYCLVEYDVESCSAAGETSDGCTDSRRVSLTMPTGGSVIYGVGHQSTGGIGSTLYREDGQVICSSIPTYGQGNEAGNETGYIVRMSTCYPYPGSVKISPGETLVLEANYSRDRERHTGVMGFFTILVADGPVEKHEVMTKPVFLWDAALLGIAIAIAAAIAYRKWREGKTAYQSITT